MRSLLLVAAALLSIAAAHAEDAPAGTPQVAMAPGSFAGLAPRQLLREAPLAYPKSVVPEDREEAVTLSYTIEADGHVGDIAVVKGSSYPFIEEARKALRSRVYTPAATATPDRRVQVLFHEAPAE